MINLLYKEFKLVVTPMTFFFALLTALILIPNYPYCVGVGYGLLALFITFNTARMNNDHEFMAMLPIPRNDIVKAKFLDAAAIELIMILVAVPFALLSSLLLNKSGNLVGIDANFAFFGYTFIEYAVFNAIFLPMYFKSGYKVGVPMLAGLGGYLIVCLVLEVLTAVVPALHNVLDGTNAAYIGYRVGVCIFGIIVYALTMLSAYKISVKRFENVSL